MATGGTGGGSGRCGRQRLRPKATAAHAGERERGRRGEPHRRVWWLEREVKAAAMTGDAKGQTAAAAP
uniref:Uncharacterized protein n=1 Tax=Oryza sativa subsp. japonica TaxID=39947 RepID=Q69K38_ORYSJ|nr:hypothetical protein [Oryza sativa Japonica Group]BAD46556.1 hypothetical protein [Oryza sativa Japonica Group]